MSHSERDKHVDTLWHPVKHSFGWHMQTFQWVNFTAWGLHCPVRVVDLHHQITKKKHEISLPCSVIFTISHLVTVHILFILSQHLSCPYSIMFYQHTHTHTLFIDWFSIHFVSCLNCPKKLNCLRDDKHDHYYPYNVGVIVCTQVLSSVFFRAVVHALTCVAFFHSKVLTKVFLFWFFLKVNLGLSCSATKEHCELARALSHMTHEQA